MQSGRGSESNVKIDKASKISERLNEQKVSGGKQVEAAKRKRKKKRKQASLPAAESMSKNAENAEKKGDTDIDLIDGLFDQLKAKKKAKVTNRFA